MRLKLHFTFTILLILFARFSYSANESSCPSELQYNQSKTNVPFVRSEFNDGCFVDVDRVSIDSLIVDTRARKEFEAFHVLGSINLQGDSILAKSYLRNEQIVVLGEPHERRLLGELCSRLERKGFSHVQIVPGGALALSAIRKTNRPATLIRSQYISSREFVVELFSDQGRLIFLEEQTVRQSGLVGLQNAVTIDLEKRQASSEKLVELSRDSRYPTFVLGTEEQYRTVRSWFSSHQINNVYFVEGGVPAFQDYVQKNQQVQLAMKSVPNRYSCS